MQPFHEIHARAIARHGHADIAARLVQPRAADQLAAIPDHRWLAMMAQRVFSAGFVWKIIQAKWEGFEAAFDGFDPERVAEYGAEDLDRLLGDSRVVRNRQKITATVHNAGLVRAVADEHGSFGHFIAAWPAEDFVGLWAWLGRHGKRLGGASGAYLLRFAGWDSPVLSKDVVAALVAAGVVDKAPTGKRAQARVQEAFNTWCAESGLSRSSVSRILAASIDA